jgi:hypothetical protein
MTEFPAHALRIAQDPTLHDDDHFTTLGDGTFYSVRAVRAALRKETTMHDAYRPHLAAARAAYEESTKSDFEREWQTARSLELEDERARNIDAEPIRALSASDLEPYRAPNPYAEALKRLRGER